MKPLFRFPILTIALAAAPLSAPAAPAPAFQAETIDAAISIGYGLAIEDLNADKKPDIFLADAKEIVCYTGPDWKKHVLAKGLSARDNVCLATADLDGDGKSELAVGANWNPGNTTDPVQSGSSHFLQHPSAADALWTPVNLPHEPTVHRMHWVRCGGGAWSLVVLPLHGRDSKNGIGPFGSRINAHLWPGREKAAAADAWQISRVEESLRITHNFDLRPRGDHDQLLIGGKEAIVLVDPVENGTKWKSQRLKIAEPKDEETPSPPFPGCGEIRFWNSNGERFNMATIEPFHGNMLVAYRQSADGATWSREIIDDSLNSGHALACADLLGIGTQQIVAGWREPNEDGKVGIKIFWEEGTLWKSAWLANNTIACEDLKVGDLDGDGDLDIVAAGRGTKNVILLRNQLKKN